MEKRIIDAINYMIEKHGSDTRKGSKIPYATHLLGVMNILLEEQAFDPAISDDVMIAGLFHDLNEDAGISIEEISKNFNPEIARLVKDSSEPEELKKDSDKKGTWKKRKEHTLNTIKNADRFSKLVFCADKLDNARAIQKDLTLGEDVWKRFNASKDEILWYYDSALDACNEGDSIANTRVYRLLKKIVEELKK